MKRYSHLLAGASWIDEYGDPDKPEDWAFMSKYSPYQNVRPGVRYPPTFFYLSTKDDRVHPGHARKMAAKLQAGGKHRLLPRVSGRRPFGRRRPQRGRDARGLAVGVPDQGDREVAD